MNNEINLYDVKERLKYAGFGTQFNAELEKRVAAGEIDIKMSRVETVNGFTMKYEPEIAIKEDNVYYNGMRATRTELETGKEISQWFSSKIGITKREAENLLSDTENPRAAFKGHFNDQNELQHSWVSINFKAPLTDSGNHQLSFFSSAYSASIADRLTDFTFLELQDQAISREVVKSLQKGETITLTPREDSDYKKVLAYVNASKGTLTIMDESGTMLKHDQFRTPEAKKRHQESRADWMTRQTQEGGRQTDPTEQPGQHQSAAPETGITSTGEPPTTIDRKRLPKNPIKGQDPSAMKHP
ncbi:hypothetical protein PV783_13770 [Chitinophaga sp. CC14]|uniref:hypothetical protein n=1 Tax=Chitinophaga sp. CC14 TaxID=3029199 RepID=UPI003B7955A4